MTEKERQNILAWFEKADHDLLSVSRLIDIAPPILDVACFHCQQSIEKNLKAFLIYNNVEIERTHNIEHLLEECAIFDPGFGEIDPQRISSFAVGIRYPDNNEMPELSEAKFYYQLAEQVKSIVRERVILTPTVKKEITKKELLSEKKKPNGLLPKKSEGNRKI